MGSPSKRKTPAGRKKTGGEKSAQSLLVEILTEELPPKSLTRLSDAFSENIFNRLKESGFLAPESSPQPYATPRRLAVVITNVLDKQPDRIVERKGPAVPAALDATGEPTPALRGFAKSCGVAIDALEKGSGDKGEYFVYRSKQKGEPLAKHLATIVEASLKDLPASKLMRWGAHDAEFVRPVHGLMMLHGKKAIAGEVLGLASGRKTRGHRFLSRGFITINDADNYEKTLEKSGRVIVSLVKRRNEIAKQLGKKAGEKSGYAFPRPAFSNTENISDDEMMAHLPVAKWILDNNETLLDEVTALVEWPKVYLCKFNPDFLQIPAQCISLSMQKHQRYFPLVNKKAKLLSDYLVVSNIETAAPTPIIHGNERVLHARLSDAKFFFEQDKKTKLADRVPKLANVVYHNKLGTQLDRVRRMQGLAKEIAHRLGLDAKTKALVERAAYLCKADLLTEMVGEFPELQGVMGAYYAINDGETPAVAQAIEAHYRPRFAGDSLPRTPVSIGVALADKLDTLVGIYGIGLVPTGDKDPFGLRRQALGVLRVLMETPLPLDLVELLQSAKNQFPVNLLAEKAVQELHEFMLERLKPYLREKGYKADEIEAVIGLGPTRVDQVLPRLAALQDFRRLPEAEALAAANKRIRNILRQAGNIGSSRFDAGLFKEEAEKRLAAQVHTLDAQVAPLLNAGDYKQALQQLAGLRVAVDEFFDRVMVMVDDQAIRNNRLALLHNLSNLFLRVADISRLQPQNQTAA
jgi:glycyl-tRNA synthetase beta chain